MTDYKQGDVILVPYPFAERASRKNAPLWWLVPLSIFKPLES